MYIFDTQTVYIFYSSLQIEKINNYKFWNNKPNITNIFNMRVHLFLRALSSLPIFLVANQFFHREQPKQRNSGKDDQNNALLGAGDNDAVNDECPGEDLQYGRRRLTYTDNGLSRQSCIVCFMNYFFCAQSDLYRLP